MLVLITYDVETLSPAGRKRLRQVARVCQDYGQRVQNSVFECQLTEAQYVTVKHLIENIITNEKDSVRFYHLGNKWRGRVETLGRITSYDVEAPLII